MRGRRGLTLIEVVVALSIGSLVIFAVLGVLGTARRSQLAGEERTDLFQSVRVTLNQLERDLSVAAYVEDDWQFEFIATDEVVNGIPMDTLEFATASGDPLGSVLPTGDLVRVNYYIDVDPDTLHAGLVRSSLSIPLLEEMPPEQLELATRRYCPWATGLDLWFYDMEVQDWTDTWEERTEPPPAVRLVLYTFMVDPEAGELVEELTIDDVTSFSTVVYLKLADKPLGTGQVREGETQAQPGMAGEPEGEEPGPGEGMGEPDMGGIGDIGDLGNLPGMPGAGGGAR